MKETATVIIILTLLFACSHSEQSDNILEKQIQQDINTRILFDTLTPKGTRITIYGELDLVDSLIWKGEEYERKIVYQEDDFRKQGTFRWENDSLIGISYSCGSPCWGYWIFPKNNHQEIKNYFFTINFDLENNLVAYYEDNMNDNPTIIIENMINDEKDKFRIKIFCEATFPYYCELNSDFRNKELYYEWTTSLDSANAEIKNEIFKYRKK
ncbi:hypothetical protein RCC89_03360 [Cytophagaceae bacterium ABcell3]|nr:hypothetical protein RCC89_03360 [Cytophagaceae bacterium ABcell3]